MRFDWIASWSLCAWPLELFALLMLNTSAACSKECPFSRKSLSRSVTGQCWPARWEGEKRWIHSVRGHSCNCVRPFKFHTLGQDAEAQRRAKEAPRQLWLKARVIRGDPRWGRVSRGVRQVHHKHDQTSSIYQSVICLFALGDAGRVIYTKNNLIISSRSVITCGNIW